MQDTNLQAASAIDDLADQLEKTADEIIANRAKQPENKLESLIRKMDYTIDKFARASEHRNNSANDHMKNIVKLAHSQNNTVYMMCFLLVVMIAAFVFSTFQQQKKIEKLSEEIRTQPVAKIDTGEGKLAFEKLGDQLMVASGNTVLAINQNTDEKLKAMQEDMMAKLNKIIRPAKPTYKKLQLHTKKVRKHMPPVEEKVEIFDKIEPYMPPIQKPKNTIDFNKDTGKAVIR